MRIVCKPIGNELHVNTDTTLPVLLYGRAANNGQASAGAAIVDNVRKKKLIPSPLAWDFLSISLSVIAADHSVSRSFSPDGWTRQIELEIGVNEILRWSSEATEIEKMLGFLTNDIWSISFTECPFRPKRPRRRSVRPKETAVALLSGGLDSLVGVLNLAQDGIAPYTVSQLAHGDGARQRLFASKIGGGLAQLQTNHIVKHPGQSERSQRARSMVFLSLGVLVASSLSGYSQGDTIPLFVNENGFISVNPPLTEGRLGSLSTRTTHPVFISQLQSLLDRVDLRVRLHNKFQFKTKGEMLAECLNQSDLRRFAHTATSCGRFRYNGLKHCGRCIPCIVRRAAFHKWGYPDHTQYVYTNLSIDDGNHARFDDVRSCRLATLTLDTIADISRTCGSLSSNLIEDSMPYCETVRRGVSEIRNFLDALGVT